ncbi:hypothetical protein BDP27DRAFT_1418143 [Rhodocollybia butyracea]|uniref:Uncharacterized protein n=1 Tax=Rhodocollybia butyracea TaxID=206335 RepID=A0A9P5Q269_9AGAR|nr:hypothetical protein BDP27DRAFT_1418143 [Rhodocollybia butyracea]
MAQVIVVTSIFVPGSLTIVSSPAQSMLLEIPTIDLNAVAPALSSIDAVGTLITTLTDVQEQLSFSNPSQRWSRLLGQSLLSSSAPTWDAPAGCELSCNYSFSYAAPALNCTALSREDIWPNNNASSNSSLLGFPSWVEVTFGDYPPQADPQFTYYSSSSGLPTSPTLDLYYIEGLNTSNLILFPSKALNISKYHPQGVHCRFQNAVMTRSIVSSKPSQASLSVR